MVIKDKFLLRVLHIVMQHKLWLLGMAILSMIYIALNMSKPYVLSLLFDIGIANKSISDIANYTAAFAGIMLATVAWSVCYSWISSNLMYSTSYDLREVFLRKLMNLPLSFYEQNSAGDVITRLDSDAHDVRDFVLDDVMSCYTSVLRFICACAFLGLMQWKMLLANFLALPVLVVVLWLFRGILDRMAWELKMAMSANSKELVEGLSIVREVKAGAFEDYFVGNALNRFRHLCKTSIRNSVVHTSHHATVELVTNASYLVTVGYGGYLIVQGELTAGILLAFLTMRSHILVPVQAARRIWTRYFTVRASLHRLREYYEADDELGMELPEKGRFESAQETGLEIRDLSVAYEGKNVIQGLQLHAPRGTWLAVCGASGSGKTTLLKLLLKLVAPWKGRIFYDGVPIDHLNNRDWRKMVSYVSQEHFALNKSIRDNLLMGRKPIADERLWESLKVTELDREVRRLDGRLDFVVSEHGGRLSAGMVKRLMLSRMILDPRPIVLLDETLSTLDEEMAERVASNMKEYLPPHAIVLVVSHRPSDYAQCSHILELGTPEDSGNRCVHKPILLPNTIVERSLN